MVNKIKASVGLINTRVVFLIILLHNQLNKYKHHRKIYCSLYKQQCIQNSVLNPLKCLLFVHEVAFNDFDLARPRKRGVYLFVQFCIASHVIRLQLWLLPLQLRNRATQNLSALSWIPFHICHIKQLENIKGALFSPDLGRSKPAPLKSLCKMTV